MKYNYTILVIDDQVADTIAFALKGCPGSEDIEFLTATDGGSGLTMAARLSPALILLDIDLPVINGFEILAELQKRGVRTRVIMISGSRTDLTTAMECVKAGACDYVLKHDMQPELLLQRIRRALILEGTINVPLSELPASSQLLIKEAGRLKEEYEALKKENEKLKHVNEVLVRKTKDEHHGIGLRVAQKVLSVILAISCTLLLKWFGVIQSTPALLVIFLVPLILLLIPAEKIQSMSASVKEIFSATVSLTKDDDNNRPRSE